eukprot:CAMPEP_0170258340 /NCGR_PEP_ID=MMETSP0116_2-20130129/29035_1 /TAXON_ID=400756 /ORGANISM="Durinskia baltica, Strain CSIRO CS-38" /LENGTH=66 /DNA_ID=CAMNT_0010509373 /DNA_START=29 /DNA_END=226 /DNA_ORIENTATION=-
MADAAGSVWKRSLRRFVALSEAPPGRVQVRRPYPLFHRARGAPPSRGVTNPRKRMTGLSALRAQCS